MLQVRSNVLQVGNVNMGLHRTIRVPDGRSPAQLPPGLGLFQAYQVKDYKDKCPSLWEDNGVFIPMHDREAIWISFGSSSPRALLVGAGNVNAVTGKQLTPKLESPQNYVVAPPQPWLNGWKDTDGIIYQFVAVKYEGGQGLTVGEQILGEDSKTGGIGIAVFAPKDKTLAAQKTFHESAVASLYDSSPYKKGGVCGQSVSFTAASSVMRGAGFTEYGLGKGGRIIQKIYPDPYGLEAWEEAPESSMAIYLVGADSFKEITGIELSPLPPGHEDYVGPYFKLPDEGAGDVVGNQVFSGLKSVFVEAEEPKAQE